MFDNATITEDARFHGAIFTNEAMFREVTFTGDAVFREAVFDRGPDALNFTGVQMPAITRYQPSDLRT